MENQTKSVGQIIATTELSKAQPSTASASPASKESLKKRQDWLDKWLKMQPRHHQLKVAMVQVYDLCSEYAKSPARGKTIVIYGENGCGKSHIAKAISRWSKAVKLHLPPVLSSAVENEFGPPSTWFVNWAKIVDGFKPPRSDYQILEDLEACTLLIVDDIGAEHDPSRIGVEKIYTLLNRREFRWNIITTNIRPDQWEEKFERRVSSRMYRNAVHIDLSLVPDYNA